MKNLIIPNVLMGAGAAGALGSALFASGAVRGALFASFVVAGIGAAWRYLSKNG